MPWSSSDRRFRLPKNWHQLKQQVKARADGKCEAAPHDRRCDGIGTDCDHVIEGDDHSLDNLQWLSGPCHRAKTARESASRNRERAELRHRPTERHPGRK